MRKDALFAAIFLGLLAIFVARELNIRLSNEAPAPDVAAQTMTVPQSASAISLRKASDGHFWAESSVNGTRIRFMVDTGASVIALTPDDARRAGIDVRTLQFTAPVSTAGGRVFGAPVRLKEVKVGSIRQRDVQALVIEDGLSHSLLGMSFLGRLSRMEATPDNLILRP